MQPTLASFTSIRSNGSWGLAEIPRRLFENPGLLYLIKVEILHRTSLSGKCYSRNKHPDVQLRNSITRRV